MPLAKQQHDFPKELTLDTWGCGIWGMNSPCKDGCGSATSAVDPWEPKTPSHIEKSMSDGKCGSKHAFWDPTYRQGPVSA
eukprot:1161986-Pelagomonas_calceolata.AAC.15